MYYPAKKLTHRTDWLAHYRRGLEKSQHPSVRHFYQAGLPDPASSIDSANFVALDFETTGLNDSVDDIISIGLVPFTAASIYCEGARHWLFKPDALLAENSVIIHGITHSALQNAPDLSAVLDKLLEALAGKLVVVHYRQIERHFLNRALETRIGEGLTFPMIDTMQLELDLLKAEQSVWQKLINQKVGPVRLADCRKRYGLPHYEPHHALTDAIATAELFMAQLAHKIKPGTAIEQVWA